MSKKLVERKYLNVFYKELKSILDIDDLISCKNKIHELIRYYENQILEIYKEDKNMLKRKIYFMIKNSKSKEEKKELYELYKQL